MEYAELIFRAEYMLSERLRVDKSRLIAAAFSAWQMLQVKVEKLPAWDKYIRQLGLSDEPRLSKEDLKREADLALEKVQRLVDNARASNGGR